MSDAEKIEAIASALGYHPETDIKVLLDAIDGLRSEARGYADLSRDLHEAREDLRGVNRLYSSLARDLNVARAQIRALRSARR